MQKTKQVSPFVRIGIMFISVIIIGLLSLKITGSIIPDQPFEALIFQVALFMVVFGSTIQEFHYTSPAESMINSFMGIISLLPVYKVSNNALWWVITVYCILIFF